MDGDQIVESQEDEHQSIDAEHVVHVQQYDRHAWRPKTGHEDNCGQLVPGGHHQQEVAGVQLAASFKIMAVEFARVTIDTFEDFGNSSDWIEETLYGSCIDKVHFECALPNSKPEIELVNLAGWLQFNATRHEKIIRQ